MATTARWSLPRARHATAFAWVAGRVRYALGLSKQQFTLLLPETADFAAPPADGVLWCRLTPVPGTVEPFAALGPGRVSYRAPLAVEVELRVPGVLWENAANVAGAIREALVPSDPAAATAARRARMAAGISELYPSLPAPPDKDTVGKGSIDLVCYD